MKALGAVTALVLITVMRGFVLTVGWDWFVAPLGVASIGVAQALGLSSLITLLVHDFNEDRSADDFGKMFAKGLAVHIVALLLMFIYHLFM